MNVSVCGGASVQADDLKTQVISWTLYLTTTVPRGKLPRVCTEGPMKVSVGEGSRPRLDCPSSPLILLSGDQAGLLQEVLLHHSSKKQQRGRQGVNRKWKKRKKEKNNDSESLNTKVTQLCVCECLCVWLQVGHTHTQTHCSIHLFIFLLYSEAGQRRLEGYWRERGMLLDHSSHEICCFKSSGIYPLHQAKAINLSRSDFISQGCFFYSQAKTTLTPVFMIHQE